MRRLQPFWDDESGQEVIEWIVVTVVLLSATVVAVRLLHKALVGAFCTVLKNLAAPGSPFSCQYQP